LPGGHPHRAVRWLLSIKSYYPVTHTVPVRQSFPHLVSALRLAGDCCPVTTCARRI